MVDPGIGLDQGGNPLQEGIFGQTDGGWQPYRRRDESFASVRTAMDFDFSPKNATHKFVIDQYGQVHSAPNPTTHEAVADQAGLHDQGFPQGMSLGELYDDGSTDWYQHNTDHSPQAMEQMLYGHFGTPVQIEPTLKPSTNEERWGLQPGQADQFGYLRDTGPEQVAVEQRGGRPFGHYDNPFINRGGSVNRSLDMDPYLPWTHEAAVEKTADQPPMPPGPPQPQEPAGPQHTATVTPGQEHGIHAGTLKWLTFLDAHLNGESVRNNMANMFARYGNRASPEFGQPVTVAVHHPDHLPGAINTIETSAEGSTPAPLLREAALRMASGEIPPPPGIDPSKLKFGAVKRSFLPKQALGLGDLATGVGLALAPETGGLSLGVAGLARAAGPALMRGALTGVGSNLMGGLLGGDDAAGQNASMPPERPATALSHRHADLETPHSNPGYHDTPDGDTKQFDDQSTDPAFQNPNFNGEAGGSADGEDNVNGGIGPQQPNFSNGSVERMQLLMPLLMHYYHSDQSAANDPLVRELHSQLETEHPGYLDLAGEDDNQSPLTELFHHLREPSAIHARTAAPMSPQFQDPWGDNRDVNPGGPQFAQGQGQGRCMYCGGVTQADGTCPQCGAKNTPYGIQAPNAPNSVAPPAANPAAMPGAAPGYTARPASVRQAADHQGPVTPEQISAVQQLLIQQGRVEEVPNVPIDPASYAKEMDALRNNPNTAPTVDPSQQPPPPPPQEVAPPGATMPVPGMTAPDPSAGGGQPFMGKVATPHNGAPRCPNCGSATTGFTHDGVGNMSGECHACGKVWHIDDAGLARSTKVAGPEGDPNPLGVPAADQQAPYDPEQDQDSSHTWKTTDGQPLIEGQVYEMHTEGFQVPDKVRIVKPKPDAIVLDFVGHNDQDPTSQDPTGDDQDASPGFRHEIPRQEIEMRNITFTPAGQDSDAGDQSLDQYADSAQAPVNTESQPQPQIHSHVESAILPCPHCGQPCDPRAGHCVNCGNVVPQTLQPGDTLMKPVMKPTAAVDETSPDPDEFCPRCANVHFSSEMSSPTSTFHECYKCGHGWETKEADYIDQNTAQRQWIMDGGGPGGDDFFAEMERHKAMRESGMGTRSLADIAARDTRYQEIKERLDSNAQERTAGKKFTPHEQRQLIDEQGSARNADKLNLSGTHYETRWVEKGRGQAANGENAPDEHLFMGL